MNQTITPEALTRKDFMSDQEVRWCPGCGDYSILATVQRVMPDLGIARENMVWISGIGCSSRFPYYMNTYGFHTIHGRAPAFALGVKAANPDLSVWLVTGDGDGLSIGGNHLLHLLRRNLDINVLLFNNRIYGLTKGQYSPTSEVGKVTKSTPGGSADHPVDPSAFALGCGASFVARAVDVDAPNLGEVLKQANAHRGTSFIEIYQNCPVFNDGAFDGFVDKAHKVDRQLHVQHGKPLLFGKDNKRGLRMNPNTLRFEVVDLENGASEADVTVYDETNIAFAQALLRLPFPEFPVALGVLYRSERETYDHALVTQREKAKASNGAPDLEKLLNSGGTWKV